MSFTKKEIQSRFKALKGSFATDGIKAKDLHIFFNSSPSLAMICDPETGNAAMANAFADLSDNCSTKKKRRNLSDGYGRLFPSAEW